MDRHIEGYCNFKNGDKLEVDTVVKAEVVQIDDDLYVDFNDPNFTRMYVGNVKTSSQESIDAMINVIGSTLKIKW